MKVWLLVVLMLVIIVFADVGAAHLRHLAKTLLVRPSTPA